ncbi:MAG: hypothetical protein EOM40_12705 [Clostridia bacterium]|nr:hypothetical protein [Clostridia bacterium]
MKLREEVNILISPQELFDKLKKDKMYFDEVREPRMIHFDSWDGNVFVDQGQVVGLIDWERALWAEGLMEDRFRFHNINPSILKGYGKKKLTQSESIRCNWYDVYLYLIMMIEGAYTVLNLPGVDHAFDMVLSERTIAGKKSIREIRKWIETMEK